MGNEEKNGDKVKPNREKNYGASEGAVKEAHDSMPGLIKDRKQLTEYLKQGASSGISNDFGKPAFVDSKSDKPGRGTHPGEQISAVHSDSIAPGTEKDLAKLEEQGKKKYHLEHVSPEGSKLIHDVFSKIHNPREREDFLKNMEKFEHREGLVDPGERAKTYQQISALLEAEHSKVGGDDPHRQQAFRNVLAENIMYHAAIPKNIDQGRFQTCNVTALSERMYTRNPSVAAAMVVKAAIDGKWTDPTDSNHIVRIPQASLEPADTDTSVNPPQDNHRSYATQLLNLVMVNDALSRRHPPERYFHVKDEKEQYVERHEVKENDKWVVVTHGSPDIVDHEISDMGKRLLNDKGDFMIVNNIRHPVPMGKDGKPVDDHLVHIGSKEDLAQALLKLSKEHGFPAIVSVDAGNPLFADSPGPPGGHVVSIRKFDEATGRVWLSNQWGTKNDKVVNIEDLYNATDPMKSALRGMAPALGWVEFWAEKAGLNLFGNVKPDDK